MKLIYKNLTICSREELSIPADDTAVFKERQDDQDLCAESTMRLHLLLDKIYAGYIQVSLLSADTLNLSVKLPDIGKHAAKLQQQYLSMLLFYVLFRWDIKHVVMEAALTDLQLQRNLVQLGFQRLSRQEQGGQSTRRDDLLYHLEKADFNTALDEDGMRKELQTLSLDQLWELFPVIIKPYNEHYTSWYTEECLRIQTLLNERIVRISHIGSTAVKGLAAKPCVDILLELDTSHPQELIKTLESDGWVMMSRKQEKQGEILCFNKGYTPLGFAERIYHLHVRYPDAWGELYFCDYLRSHDELCQKYAALKKVLAQTYRRDRDGYTLAKTQFIEEITKRAYEEAPEKFKI